MRERPILFSAPMVRAILDGKKTQTRRVVDMGGIGFIGGAGQQDDPSCWGYFMDDGIGRWAVLEPGHNEQFGNGHVSIPCPYGSPGGRMWVKETFAPAYFDDGSHGYRADWTPAAADVAPEPRWTPSIHMPRWASRITLDVTGVRVERLQSISEQDAVREGCPREPGATGQTVRPGPREAFQTFWSGIYGDGSWDENPWVWVVEFRKVQA